VTDARKTTTYEIGGRTYTQRPLVLGQVRQLVEHLGQIDFSPAMAFDFVGLLDTLGDLLPVALAIVLTEDGAHPRDKDIAAVAREFEFTVEAGTALRAVEDFFALNPISSILTSIGQLVDQLKAMASGTRDGSTTSSASSPAETSPSGTPSSGA
jgi:hypothetical protein